MTIKIVTVDKVIAKYIDFRNKKEDELSNLEREFQEQLNKTLLNKNSVRKKYNPQIELLNREIKKYDNQLLSISKQDTSAYAEKKEAHCNSSVFLSGRSRTVSCDCGANEVVSDS